jgi:hypothetical protein
VFFHLRGLFATRKLALSTTLIWLSWLLIGLAYPLYNVFLPTYLASRGASFGQTSPYITWRNYAINNTCSIFGPVLAGFMCRSPWFWGRRGTMIIGAMVTMVFFFCYTQVRTQSQNVGFTCAISFCLNIYYGTLYAYTPEVFACSLSLTLSSISHYSVGLPLRPPGHRKWRCYCAQSDHGNCQCCGQPGRKCRDLFFALLKKMLMLLTVQHARPDIHMRSPLHCDGNYCRSFAI